MSEVMNVGVMNVGQSGNSPPPPNFPGCQGWEKSQGSREIQEIFHGHNRPRDSRDFLRAKPEGNPKGQGPRKQHDSAFAKTPGIILKEIEICKIFLYFKYFAMQIFQIFAWEVVPRCKYLDISHFSLRNCSKMQIIGHFKYHFEKVVQKCGYLYISDISLRNCSKMQVWNEEARWLTEGFSFHKKWHFSLLRNTRNQSACIRPDHALQ